MDAAIKNTLINLGFEFSAGCYRHKNCVNVTWQDGEVTVTGMIGNVIDTQFRICLDCFEDLDLASSMLAGALKAMI